MILFAPRWHIRLRAEIPISPSPWLPSQVSQGSSVGNRRLILANWAYGLVG